MSIALPQKSVISRINRALVRRDGNWAGSVCKSRPAERPAVGEFQLVEGNTIVDHGDGLEWLLGLETQLAVRS